MRGICRKLFEEREVQKTAGLFATEVGFKKLNFNIMHVLAI